jgi:energy-coupling factor transporter ATP-binding protein EcfA2
MRITNLHVENFLTFNSLDLKFQKNPTIFIGPNGSGKTNIIRVLEFVDSTLWHRNLVPQSVGYFKITLKLVLSKKELNLIKQYLQLIMLIHETQLLPSLVELDKEEKKRIIKNIIDLKGEFFNINDNITIEIEGYNESVTSRKIQLYWNNEDHPYTLTENNELLILNAVNIGGVKLEDLLPLINSEEIPGPKTLVQAYEQKYKRQKPNSTASFYKIVLPNFPLEDFSDYFPYIGAWFNGEELEEVASKFGNLYESFNREIKSRKFIRINGREISLFHIIATIFSSALIVLKNPQKNSRAVFL